MKGKVFRLKNFSLQDTNSAMKIGTDAILLGAWVSTFTKDDKPIKILDIGAGCGIISLMILEKTSKAVATLVEIDAKSCLDISQNITQKLFKGRACIINKDIKLSNIPSQSFDLIVSNPPYYNEQVFADSPERSIARHEKKEDGLTIEDLFSSVQKLLKKRGEFFIILPYCRLEDLRRIATKSKMKINNLVVVNSYIGKPIRILACLSRIGLKDNYQKTLESQITIMNSDNSLHKTFLNITNEFIIKED